MAFNPSEHFIKLKDKDYLPVAWRLVWFREQYPNGSIETEMLHLDLDRECSAEVVAWNPQTRRSEKTLKTEKGFVVFRAVVRDGNGGVATGTKSESAASFGDFIEKAESGSIGRALAALGFGTQFTGDELDERDRIVDSPVEPANSSDAPSIEQIKKEVEATKLITKAGSLFTFPMLISHAYQNDIKAKKETVDSLMLKVPNFQSEQRLYLMKVWRDLQAKAKEAA